MDVIQKAATQVHHVLPQFQQAIQQTHQEASQQLPFWAEYVRVFGTPVAALIAAAIAGSIAYRQSVIAKNKLKLDLFEKRFTVYEAGVELIREIVMPSDGYGTSLIELTKSIAGASGC